MDKKVSLYHQLKNFTNHQSHGSIFIFVLFRMNMRYFLACKWKDFSENYINFDETEKTEFIVKKISDFKKEFNINKEMKGLKVNRLIVFFRNYTEYLLEIVFLLKLKSGS
jgi:hypothetical protein